MSNGILERIESKLDILLSRGTSAEFVTATLEETVEKTVVTDEPAEIDSNDKIVLPRTSRLET